jgi:lipopolysaccharide exporter
MTADEQHDPGQQDLKKQIGLGFVWIIASRWGVRSLGLISTVILARLLAPEDFGLIAMASAFAAIIGGFADMGLGMALISIKNIESRHFNTAWTISIIVGVVISLIIFALGPVAADYYNEPRIEEILSWLALASFIGHTANTKKALFLKELQFNKEFQFTVITKVLSVIVAVIAAFSLRDYRALIVASVVNSAIGSMVSYIMIPHFPKFDLSARSEIMNFSLWMMLRSFALTAMTRLQQAVMGPFFGPERLSYYYMGSEIGNMLTGELGLPLGRVLLPGFSKVQDESDRLIRGLRLSFAAILIVLPFGFGIAALADAFVLLVLGEQWLAAAPLLTLLSISGAIRTIGAPFGPLLLAKKRVKHVALCMVACSVFLVVSTYMLAPTQSLVLIAWAQIITMILLLVGLIWMTSKVCLINVFEFFYMTVRPLLASVAMYFVVSLGQEAVNFSPWLALIIWPPIGAVVFFVILFVLWFAVRKPFGFEELVFKALKLGIQKIRPSSVI